MKFNKKYFILFSTLFFVECLIAMYVRDTIIRPYIGDVLVVILLYCFVKSFYAGNNNVVIAVSVLIFSYIVETLQYFNLVKYLGLQHNKFAVIIIGNSFSWIDMLCYTIGILITILVEHTNKKS